MAHEVYAFGDSHWRVYFPFLNTGDPGVFHEERGITTLDTTGSGLSGATMWGLLHDDSKLGHRRHIVETLDERGGVENVGLVFGEVDMRFHNARYFRPDGTIAMHRIYELLTRYRQFIDEDLLHPGRVRGFVFVYFGFRWPMGERTVTFHGQQCGPEALARMQLMNSVMEVLLPEFLTFGPNMHRVRPIVPGSRVEHVVSDDGVHLDPAGAYYNFVLPAMEEALNG